ncbi:uncharacterized protein LOC119991481 [Tripterygium wilfordii]|uniref:uncharacterized protein LOC119991481 n=1 Tax=Tripterygium wilfordii TaxID=458696 RepID=UPI0018F7F5E1|nr:uncharacterized protein LOC119991481 [Tripterygium wilfordii]
MTAALRLLAYGGPVDRLDEFIKIGESTAKEALLKFCKNIIQLYMEQYLRTPNMYDTQRLMNENAQYGFPGMLGSLDCMHWEWRGCPVGWQGQFTGHVGTPTLILEAVEKVFARAQESVRKDVERAFGVLQARWGITQGPVTFYDTADLRRIMMTCIILHNMIIEDERHIDIDPWVPPLDDDVSPIEQIISPTVLAHYIHMRMEQIRDQQSNAELRRDLMAHIWQMYGDIDV